MSVDENTISIIINKETSARDAGALILKKVAPFVEQQTLLYKKCLQVHLGQN